MAIELVEIEPVEQTRSVPESLPALADNSPASMMLRLMERGATLDQMKQMMDLQAEHEAREARKAYNAAFAEFKAEAVRIIKNKQVTDGPLKGKAYAELHAVVDALTPALSRHGLSASWKRTKDERDWIEVTCYLRHVSGHEESVSMGGPPDTGGAKNAIQARQSTESYLQRYTLKAICGVAEGGDDNDGNGAGRGADWIARVDEASTEDELRKISEEGAEAFKKARNVEGYQSLMRAVMKRKAALKGAK